MRRATHCYTNPFNKPNSILPLRRIRFILFKGGNSPFFKGGWGDFQLEQWGASHLFDDCGAEVSSMTNFMTTGRSTNSSPNAIGHTLIKACNQTSIKFATSPALKNVTKPDIKKLINNDIIKAMSSGVCLGSSRGMFYTQFKQPAGMIL